MRIIKNPTFFVLLYVVFMIPTYIMPYFGSNSTFLNALSLSEHFFNPAFLLHFLALVILTVLSFVRGNVIDRKWLVIFPVLAIVFDFVPTLNMVPFVPTVMHLLAIILGVAGINVAVNRGRVTA